MTVEKDTHPPFQDLCRDAETTAARYRVLFMNGVLLALTCVFACFFIAGVFRLLDVVAVAIQKTLENTR